VSQRTKDRRQFLQQSLALGGLAGAGLLATSAAQAQNAATAPAAAGGLVMELLLFRQGTLPPPPVDERNVSVPTPTLVREQLTTLPQGALQLAGSAAVLRKRADYGLIALGGWVMPVPSNGTGTIALGDVLATAPGAGQVSGSLVFTRGTYLTVGLDTLWVPKDGLQLVLSEKRRVKFNERHYFDHESFGAIVLVRAPA
jgi:hypothetical protein